MLSVCPSVFHFTNTLGWNRHLFDLRPKEKKLCQKIRPLKKQNKKQNKTNQKKDKRVSLLCALPGKLDLNYFCCAFFNRNLVFFSSRCTELIDTLTL